MSESARLQPARSERKRAELPEVGPALVNVEIRQDREYKGGIYV